MILQCSIGSFILIQNTNICVCVWMHVCLRELTAGNFFSSGQSAITVQIRKTILVASAVLFTVKDCSKLHLLQNWFCNTKQRSLHNFPWQIIQVYLPWEFWKEISNEIKTTLVFRLWYLGFIFMWARVVNVFVFFFQRWPLQCGVLGAFSFLNTQNFTQVL